MNRYKEINPKLIKALKAIYPYILIVTFVIFIRVYIVTPIRVIGISMEPTLTEGQMLILQKYDRTDLNRYDVVVTSKIGTNLIKRVIGLPGEAVRFHDGELYINNKIMNDEFASITEDFDFGVIASDEYVLLGDNRAHSSDSRFFGPFKLKDIKGKVNLSVFPFKRIGMLK